MGKKLKTKKTLLKRVRITRRGKLVKKQTRVGHLKRKWDSPKKFRKNKRLSQKNRGHIKLFKNLLGTAGGNIK